MRGWALLRSCLPRRAGRLVQCGWRPLRSLGSAGLVRLVARRRRRPLGLVARQVGGAPPPGGCQQLRRPAQPRIWLLGIWLCSWCPRFSLNLSSYSNAVSLTFSCMSWWNRRRHVPVSTTSTDLSLFHSSLFFLGDANHLSSMCGYLGLRARLAADSSLYVRRNAWVSQISPSRPKN